jgi:hypothetical protein
MVLILVFAAASSFAAPPIKELQPAKTPPPEFQELEKKVNKKMPPPQTKRLSVSELKEKLKKDPKEREKLDRINKGQKPTKELQSAKTTPPEFQELEKKANKKIPPPQTKRLSVSELKEELKKNPAEREKLEKINRGQKPTSFINKDKKFSLTWLNPFSVSEAHAGTYSWTLNEKNGFYNYSPSRARVYFTNVWYEHTWNQSGLIQVTNLGGYHGYAQLRFNAPKSGYYIINFYVGVDHGRARLDHHGTGTIVRWDSSTMKPFSFWNNFATLVYLRSGNHYLNFRPEYRFGLWYFRSVTIDSLF